MLEALGAQRHCTRSDELNRGFMGMTLPCRLKRRKQCVSEMRLSSTVRSLMYGRSSSNQTAKRSGILALLKRMTSAGGLGVGATGIEVRKVFGRHMEFPWEITGFEPGRRVITTIMGGGPVAWEATYLLEPVENGTRFTLDYRQEATGLWRLLLLGAPIVMRRLAKSDLVRPKRAVEALRPLDD
jgi:hypothetical protein